jgi:hypothetical protein
MRYVPDRTGRFPQRPHYEARELDTLFERITTDFLKAKYGEIHFPLTTADLTVLIEQDCDDLDPYADLSAYEGVVEGVTEFWPGRKPRVKISQTLSESENRENRLRTTLTHEFGHVRLHGYLFAMGTSTADLFGGGRKPDVISCKRDTMISAPKNDWMEWQAGYACGAVLMPISRVRGKADEYRRMNNLYGPVPATGAHGQALIDIVVTDFQVSRDAARVRLSVLGFLGATAAVDSLFS